MERSGIANEAGECAMSKIVVKIVSDGSNVSGGMADYPMLQPFVADIVVLDTDIVEANISGGILPIDQDTADELGLSGGGSVDEVYMLPDGAILHATSSATRMLPDGSVVTEG